MAVMAVYSEKFGRVSMLSIVITLATGMIRVSLTEGVIVGLGYVLTGILYDIRYFLPILKQSDSRTRRIRLLTIASVTGVATLVPYRLFRFYVLGPTAFIVLLPSYGFSAFKNLLFSLLGTSLAIVTVPRVSPRVAAYPPSGFQRHGLWIQLLS